MQLCLYVLIITVLGRKRQATPQNSLASQSSLISKLQAKKPEWTVAEEPHLRLTAGFHTHPHSYIHSQEHTNDTYKYTYIQMYVYKFVHIQMKSMNCTCFVFCPKTRHFWHSYLAGIILLWTELAMLRENRTVQERCKEEQELPML